MNKAARNVLFLLLVILVRAQGIADTRTNFVAIRLKPATQKGATWLQVDSRSPNQIEPEEVYKKGDCFKLTISAISNKKHRLESLFKTADPIALSTRTHQQALAAGVEDVLVAYNDWKSSPAKLWNNINIFGPDIANDSNTVLLNIRIANIKLSDVSRKSYFEQAVGLAQDKIKETQAFSPLINRIVNQIGSIYNTNVTVNELSLEKVTKDGYWLIVPDEDKKTDKAFVQSINSGQSFISSDGDVEGFDEKNLPFFFIIKATSMNFEPIVWHSEFGNLVDAAAKAPDEVVRAMVQTAASDATAAGERYLLKLMQRRLDLARVGAGDADGKKAKLAAFTKFLDDSGGLHFSVADVNNSLRDYVTSLVTVDGGDTFPTPIQSDASRLIRSIRKRLDLGDVIAEGSQFTLSPSTETNGRFSKLEFASDCSGVDVSKVIQEHREFLTAGDIFLVNEGLGIVSGIKSRFEIPSADGVSLTTAQLLSYLTALRADQCVCRNGKIVQLRGAAAVISRLRVLIDKLPQGPISRADNPDVYNALHALADFVASDNASESDIALAQKALDDYTQMGFSLHGQDWNKWLDMASSSLTFEKFERPQFYTLTATRKIYNATKQKHISVAKEGTKRSAVYVFGDLFSNVQAQTPIPPDATAIATFLHNTTSQLPPYDKKHDPQLKKWLATAVYIRPADVWAPPATRDFAMLAFETLTAEINNHTLTPNTYRWAVDVFGSQGEKLNSDEQQKYAQSLVDASTLSSRPDSGTWVQPNKWKLLKDHRFAEGTNGYILVLDPAKRVTTSPHGPA